MSRAGERLTAAAQDAVSIARGASRPARQMNWPTYSLNGCLLMQSFDVAFIDKSGDRIVMETRYWLPAVIPGGDQMTIAREMMARLRARASQALRSDT
jgi:hypothetical protein